MSFDEETSLRLVGELLSLAHLVNSDVKEIRVREVKVVDQSLTVEVLAASEDPIKLRGQAASVMGGLSGLDLEDLFPAIRFTHFAVRLCDRVGEERLWIVSSPEDARFAETGAVRWLANSICQDNTPAYRRSIADRQIAMLETAMRDLLDEHWLDALGAEYPEQIFTETMLKDLRKAARREGEDDNDGRTLLDFTFLPQLSRLLCAEQSLLEHGCVDDTTQIEEGLKALNRIRRKVAHHRDITATEVDRTKEIAQSILGPVGTHHPDLIEDFLVERWDEAVAGIVQYARSNGFSQGKPPPRGAVSEAERREIAAKMLGEQFSAASTALMSVGCLVVPPTRQQRHDQVIDAFTVLADGLGDMVRVARKVDATRREVQAAADCHAAAMQTVRELGEQILESRVMEP